MYVFVVVCCCMFVACSSCPFENMVHTINYHTYRTYVFNLLLYTRIFIRHIYMHEYMVYILSTYIFTDVCSLVVSFTFVNHCIYIDIHTYIYICIDI